MQAGGQEGEPDASVDWCKHVISKGDGWAEALGYSVQQAHETNMYQCCQMGMLAYLSP